MFQIRSEGMTLSDRRVVKLLKLFAASALIDGRPIVDDSDLFVLRHVWNSVDQIPLVDDIVGPVLERYRRDHPDERASGAERARSRRHPRRAGRHPRPPAGRRAAVGRAAVLAAAQPAGDPGRAAGDRHGHRATMAGEVDKLLEGVFESSKWSG